MPGVTSPRAGAASRAARSGPSTARPPPQVVELDAALVLPVHTSEQPLAELGVPHQRRQVVEDHGHADVVDRRVGERPDGVVGDRVPAEEPEVAGAGQLDRLVAG